MQARGETGRHVTHGQADGDLGMEVGLRGGAASLLYDGSEPADRIRLRVEAGEDGRVNANEAHLVPAVVDEPEPGLHPAAVTILAEMMRSTSARSQILLSTQSVTPPG
jgi:hypothetical protein